MHRVTSIVLAALLVLAPALPAFAGPSEASFLSRIAGLWSGSGRMTGAEAGPISCKMSFRPSGDRLNYTGRCNVQDMGGQGFNGSINYNDQTRRYEVRSAAGVVVGVRRGNSLVFTTKSQTMSGTAYSTMTVSPSSISVNFSFIRQGQKTVSHVSFSK
jgi:hypothetical protein